MDHKCELIDKLLKTSSDPTLAEEERKIEDKRVESERSENEMYISLD